ncbi:hypothetical protein SLA2020_276890 [Shorea laevis]
MDTAIRIGQSLGDLLEVDGPLDGSAGKQSFLRLRVSVDLTKPLIPGFTHHRPPKIPAWIQYKYERLSDYCYSCGRLGHLSFFCPVSPKLPDIGWFNDKLRANPMRDTRVEILKPSSFFSPSSSSSMEVPRSITIGSRFQKAELQPESTHPPEPNLSSTPIPTRAHLPSSETGTLVISPIPSPLPTFNEKSAFVNFQLPSLTCIKSSLTLTHVVERQQSPHISTSVFFQISRLPHFLHPSHVSLSILS